MMYSELLGPLQSSRAQLLIAHKNKKVKQVTFSDTSQTLCLGELMNIEEQFLSMYYDFSGFPKFLKMNNVIHPLSSPTKLDSDCFIHYSSMQALFACPCTTVKEISILFK